MNEFDKYFNDNEFTNKAMERYNALDDGIKKRLDELSEKDIDEYQLNVIKRKRVIPKKGDLFLVSPVRNIFFWGVVINSGVSAPEGDDLIVVFILKDKAASLNDVNVPKSVTNLLIEPAIVEKWYWNKGFFFNVGLSIDIPKNLDYGFYSVANRKYVDEYKKTIPKQPEICGTYGVCTGSGVAYEMNRELIIEGLI